MSRIQHDHLGGVSGPGRDAHNGGGIGDGRSHLFFGDFLIRGNGDDIFQGRLHFFPGHTLLFGCFLLGQLLIIQRIALFQRSQIRGKAAAGGHRGYGQIGDGIGSGQEKCRVILHQMRGFCLGSPVFILPGQNRLFQGLIGGKLHDDAPCGFVLGKLRVEELCLQCIFRSFRFRVCRGSGIR